MGKRSNTNEDLKLRHSSLKKSKHIITEIKNYLSNSDNSDTTLKADGHKPINNILTPSEASSIPINR